jgi:hypothetical protein
VNQRWDRIKVLDLNPGPTRRSLIPSGSISENDHRFLLISVIKRKVNSCLFFFLFQWIFISFDSDSITTYSVYRDSLKGPQIMFVGTTRLPIFGSVPLLLNAGLLLLLDSSGKIVQTKLEIYGFLNDSTEQEYTLDDAVDRLSKAILMKRYY